MEIVFMKSPAGSTLKGGTRRLRTERSFQQKANQPTVSLSTRHPPEPELGNRQMAEKAYGHETGRPALIDLIASFIDVLLQAIQQRVSLIACRQWQQTVQQFSLPFCEAFV